MKINRSTLHSIRFALLLAAAATALPAAASDHADPMNLLNPFEIQADPEANITDLHAFIVDKDWKLINRAPDATAGDNLILSLCVRRAISEQERGKPKGPGDSTKLRPGEYTYRIHLDFNPPVRIFNWKTFESTKEGLKGDPPALAAYLAKTNDDRAAQFRYGGIIERPGDIAEEAGLEFRIEYVPGQEMPGTDDVKLVHQILTGKWTGNRSMNVIKPDATPAEGQISTCTGIFDDPFIFPRFFRRNVIGIVTAIPLDRLPSLPESPHAERPLILWATTHDAKNRQIDHVGRSLRTQLPRFGYLNTVAPASQRTMIQRVHKNPTLVEDSFATLVGPLFAHRHYDEVPDVMIYNLNAPAKFPNGRALEDDVAALLAEGGETLLYELSFAESEQFPRATENDKPFLSHFPFLAPRWTNTQIKNAARGAILTLSNGEVHPVPFGALAEVTTPLAFKPATQTKLWILGLLTIATLAGGSAFLLWLGFHLGRHRGLSQAGKPDDEGQGLGQDEELEEGSCFKDVHSHVIDRGNCRPYLGNELPRNEVSFWKVASGILPWGKPSLLNSAIRRTLKSRKDLRWGSDGNGITRLIHPNGICLSGEWIIDPNVNTRHTGWFEKGRTGLIVARLSPARAETRRGHWRSHGLTAKIYPTTDRSDASVRKSASFFTQEDLGGTREDFINDMVFINAPDLHAWRRGKGFFSLLLTGIFFARINVNATIRQLHEIAELHHPGTPPIAHPRCPTFMRLKVMGNHRTHGESLDVRDEILDHIYPKPDSGKTPGLVFSIEVSDHDQEPPSPGVLAALIKRDIPEGSWVTIGRIVFDEAACGLNGDRVIHFHHPRWREDFNNPKSESEVK
ncbi:MAG: hypothetical protein ABIS50_01925 [Luteolibacter sp.]|uniref:hypothetical protein n=1 Tax=Luteolibacter sp. TaxID=1962973 RepID=UPI0032659E09